MSSPERPSAVRATTIADTEEVPTAAEDAAETATRRALLELALGGLVRARQNAEIVADSLAKAIEQAKSAEVELRQWVTNLDNAIAGMRREV